MNQNRKVYKTEREGQIEFFDNYGIPWEENDGVLVENCDGVYNGVLFEFKLNINDLNKTLFQAVKYLSQMRLNRLYENYSHGYQCATAIPYKTENL